MRFLLAVVLCVVASTADARRHGACDGVHRCRCGTTQANYFGLPWTYKGHNLKQAHEWVRTFARTQPRAGAVVYQHGGGPTGHVSRIVSYSGGCRATVSDDRGTYTRDICGRGAVYLSVGG